jgi:hypothetical protein
MRRQTVMKIIWFLVITFVLCPIVLALVFHKPLTAGGDALGAGYQAGRASAPLILILGVVLTFIGIKFRILPGTRD